MEKKTPKRSQIAVIGLIGMIMIGILIVRFPRSVDISSSGDYTIALYAIGSPDWPFGDQDGRIIFRKKYKKISSFGFRLSNDGKSMDEDNWTVSWGNDKVTVTIIGEEQRDKTVCFYYDGKTTD